MKKPQMPDIDVYLSDWSGAENGSFPVTPETPRVVQLGRQLASTMEERTTRQIQSSWLIGIMFQCVGFYSTV